MSTTTTEQQSTLAEQRQSAETALHDSQAETQAARVALAEVQSKLESEQNFRAKLEERYNAAAVDDNGDMAMAVEGEINRSKFKIRGLELRLAAATEEVSRCEQAEKPLAYELDRVLQ